jgi:hypothetical protein
MKCVAEQAPPVNCREDIKKDYPMTQFQSNVKLGNKINGAAIYSVRQLQRPQISLRKLE